MAINNKQETRMADKFLLSIVFEITIPDLLATTMEHVAIRVTFKKVFNDNPIHPKGKMTK